MDTLSIWPTRVLLALVVGSRDSGVRRFADALPGGQANGGLLALLVDKSARSHAGKISRQKQTVSGYLREESIPKYKTTRPCLCV
jgi:hypothetical protein